MRLCGALVYTTNAEFMRECLTNSQHGYYTNNVEIGPFQDFTTAPTTTPMFGTLLAKWVEWAHKGLGSPRNFNLVELGPGTGALIRPLFKALPDSVADAAEIHLVEVSEKLRKAQAKALDVDMSSMNAYKFVPDDEMMEEYTKYRIPYHNGNILTVEKDASLEVSSEWTMKDGLQCETGVIMMDGDRTAAVTWHSHVSTLPRGPVIVIANEFFDALPVHQFQWGSKKKKQQQKEEEEEEEEEEGDHQLFSQNMVVVEEQRSAMPTSSNDSDSTFSGSSSSSSNNLFSLNTKFMETTPPPHISFVDECKSKDCFGFELCPEALDVARFLSKRMEQDGGASLVIDYGDETTTDTLRALSKKDNHNNIIIKAADVTADVHFGSLALAFEEGGEGIKCHPMQPQAYLLTELMGESIKSYLEIMRAGYREDMDEEEASIYHLAPLVDRQGMGSYFKCICAAPKSWGVPLGWNMREMVLMMEKAMQK
eukprot:jgi/Bigna1/66336/fgenesh1_pg.1_\